VNKQEILIGKDLKLNKEKLQDGGICCLITGQSGSGKTFLTKKIINSLSEDNSSQIIVIDFEGDYFNLRENNKFKLIGSDLDYLPEYKPDFNYELDKIKELCDCIVSDEDINYVIDVSDLNHNAKLTKNFIIDFVENLISFRKRTKSCCLFIDDLSNTCYRYSNSELDIDCKNAIVKLQRLGRSRLVSSFFVSQRIKSLPKDITSKCNTILMGKITSEDFERNALYIGVNKNYFEEIVNYEFVAYGHGFDLEHPVIFNDLLELNENDFETIKKEYLVTP
jgi:energy-coupling factor transporter ATP-binding protein EcfA2